MRNLLSLRRPLPRRTLVFCHGVVQLGLLLAGGAWFVRHSPWLTSASWLESWPTLTLGMGVLLLAMVGTRLLAELLMLPHHLAGLRQGFSPGAVMTRSFERRPAVHDPEGTWVSEARPAPEPAILDEEAVGSARVIRPRRPFSARQAPDDTDGTSRSNDAGEVPSRQEPSL